MLGEIIVVEQNHLDNILIEERPYESRSSATYKALNEFHFEELWELLSEKNVPSDIKVFTSKGGETWLVVLPEKFVKSLLSRAKQNNDEIIDKWASKQGFDYLYNRSQVAELFSDLMLLAQEATKKGNRLIYWGAL